MATYGEALQRARQLLGAGDLSQAEAIYRRLVDAAPRDAEAWHELGIVHLQADRPDAAAECLRQAAALAPTTAAYHVNLAAAYRMLQRPAEAIASFEQALKLAPPAAEVLNNFALALKDAGRPDAALRRAFDRALSLRPNYPNGHFNRGNLLVEMGRLEEAAASYERVVAQAPSDVAAQINLARLWGHLGRIDDAIGLWRRVLAVEPDFAEGLNNLGSLLARRGETEEAAACWVRALELKPDFAEAYNNLATLLSDQNQLQQAEDCCRRAVGLQPKFAEARGNLAGILARQGKLDEALDEYRRTLALRPDFAEMHNNLGAVFEQLGKYDEAADCCRRAFELKPDFLEATSNLGVLLAQQGKTQEAQECYRRAVTLQPDEALWRLNLLSLCPSIFRDNEEIDDYRRQLLREVEAFDSSILGPDFPARASNGCTPSFNLAYQGRDDRVPREAYGRLFENCFRPAACGGSSGRPRLGFVVTNRHEKAFIKSIGGVLERMDPERFDLVIIGSQGGIGTLAAQIHGPSIRLVGVPNQFERWVEAVRGAQVDVLYFWEAGTDATNYFLPFCRLAPVQCVSWGTAFTSGIPAMDHYLSSELLEPAGAQSQYTENLVLAKTLLTYQRRLAPPQSPRPRESFGIAPDRHLYLCAQQLRKFHPDFDPLLAGILRRDSRAVIVAAQDQHGAFLSDELRRRFAVTMPDVAERVVFLPCQPNADYLSLTAAADVLLDPLHYCGSNSSYDGFSLGRPVVTLPGASQRGRYTLACYLKMGLSDCVARDEEHYIELAVALGTDAAFRAEMRDKIRHASPVLFEEREAVSEHERIFEELVEEARTGKRACAS